MICLLAGAGILLLAEGLTVLAVCYLVDWEQVSDEALHYSENEWRRPIPYHDAVAETDDKFRGFIRWR